MNAMREKEDDLALFLEMRKREKDKADLLLLQDSDGLDEPLGIMMFCFFSSNGL